MKTIPVVKALLLDSEDNLLVLRRSQSHPDLAGKPDLPGGMIESGEEPGQSLVREIKEETGLDVSANALQLLYAASDTYKGESHTRLLYAAHLAQVKPEVRISWEHDEYTWLPTDDLETIALEFGFFYREALQYIHKNGLL